METKRKKGIIQLMRNRILKKYSFLIASIMILFLALSYSASASAVQIFYDGFETGNYSTNGWLLTGNSTINNWTIITNNSASGTNSSECGRTDNSDKYVSILTKNISTSGFSNITLTFSRYASNLDSLDNFAVEYWNGSQWLSVFSSLGSSLNDGTWTNVNYSLLNGGNLSSFGLRFKCSASGSLEFCRIDEVNITAITPSPPSVIFVSQVPSEITSFNLFNNTGLNVTYNITDIDGNLNASTIKMYYKTNNSISDVIYYENGTSITGFQSIFPTSNITSNFLFRLFDNQIYPATYNYPERSMELTPHLFISLTTSATHLSVGFRNVSSISPYGFFEIMLNKTNLASTSTALFYCNSTYDFLSNVHTNPNCIQFATASNNNYDHNHSIYSSHQIYPFAINITDGTLNGIVVTPNSYFQVEGNTIGWNAYYISNLSRTGAIRTTINNGVTWTNQTYTIDAHLHQYREDTNFSYYVCANDTGGLSTCSNLRNNIIGLSPLIPTAPLIISPISAIYKDVISINYTSSSSPTGNAIANYSIFLYNTDETINTTIISNNGVNLGYLWNSTSVSDGNYKIKVVATDNKSFSSFSFSQVFTIHNFVCIQNWSIRYTPCGINDNASCGTFNNKTIYYIDINSCNNLTGIPADNGTCNFCDYCSPSFYCLSWASCFKNWVNCSAINDSNHNTCCAITGLNSDCNYSGNFMTDFMKPCGAIKSILYVNQYPYVDCNTTYPIALTLELNNTPQKLQNLFIDFPADNQTFNFTFNNATQQYEITFIFDKEKDQPFIIWNDYPLGAMKNITGNFIVRCPYYWNIQVYELNPKNLTNPYINNHAFITTEFAPSYMGQSTYNYQVEQYARPLGFKDFFLLKVFHAPYISGTAQIKLWERNKVYGIRLIDGNIDFQEGVYSRMNITKLYGTNIYLGSISVNSSRQQNQTIQFFLTKQEFHPYQWLVNLIFVLSFIVILIMAVWLVIIGLPIIAWYSAITLSVVAIILRILIWLNYGF